MKRTSKAMTAAGIMSGMGILIFGIPASTLTAYAYIIKDGPPKWFMPFVFPMIFFGLLIGGTGHVLTGVFGQGQDDKPTAPQVGAATAVAIAENMTANAADPKAAPQLGGK